MFQEVDDKIKKGTVNLIYYFVIQSKTKQNKKKI